jgi:hypothetical protein
MAEAWHAFRFDARHGDDIANDLAGYAEALDLQKRGLEY